MRSLRIAVDCDDVLLPSLESIVDIYNQTYGTDVQYKDAYSAGATEWQATPDEIAERIYEIQLRDEYAAVQPFDDAIEVCARLAANHSLNLITARPGRLMPVTLAMINQYFPDVFSEIEHVGMEGSRGDVCRLIQADVLIDDRYKHLQTAFDCGIKNLIWFGEYPWQYREVDDKMGVVICKDWQEVEREIERIARQ